MGALYIAQFDLNYALKSIPTPLSELFVYVSIAVIIMNTDYNALSKRGKKVHTEIELARIGMGMLFAKQPPFYGDRAI
jgi:hypothetical protein